MRDPPLTSHENSRNLGPQSSDAQLALNATDLSRLLHFVPDLDALVHLHRGRHLGDVLLPVVVVVFVVVVVVAVARSLIVGVVFAVVRVAAEGGQGTVGRVAELEWEFYET